MLRCKVIFYQDTNKTSPVFEWLENLRLKDLRAWTNCFAKIKLLAEDGHELRRPASDYLRDGIRELRIKQKTVQYRILYFFFGKNIAVLTHSIIKKSSAVPNVDIEKALARKLAFEKNPFMHTFGSEYEETKN